MTTLQDKEYDNALRRVQNGVAHSDISIPLEREGRTIEGTEVVYGDASAFGSVGLARDGRVFAFSSGMKHVTLRLSQDHAASLRDISGQRDPSFASGQWINLSPFDDKVDLQVWVRLAYEDAT